MASSNNQQLKEGDMTSCRLIIAVALACFALMGLALLVPASSMAAAEIVAVEGANFNLQMGMDDNLRIYIGKSVTLMLSTGNEITGKVKAVDRGFVHIESLAGRDFYDALIRTDQIVSLIARFRQFK